MVPAYACVCTCYVVNVDSVNVWLESIPARTAEKLIRLEMVIEGTSRENVKSIASSDNDPVGCTCTTDNFMSVLVYMRRRMQVVVLSITCPMSVHHF